MIQNKLPIIVIAALILLTIIGLFLVFQERPSQPSPPSPDIDEDLSKRVDSFGENISFFDDFEALLNDIDKSYDITF